MKNTVSIIVCTLLLVIVTFDVSAGVRYRLFNNQLEVEVSHPDGLLGYVIKSPNRNGNVEANPVFADCPVKQTEVLAPGANHVHGHWVLLSTCNGESFMYEFLNTPSSWEDAEEKPYTPPTPSDPDDSASSLRMLMLLAGIAAVASVLCLILLLVRRSS